MFKNIICGGLLLASAVQAMEPGENHVIINMEPEEHRTSPKIDLSEKTNFFESRIDKYQETGILQQASEPVRKRTVSDYGIDCSRGSQMISGLIDRAHNVSIFSYVEQDWALLKQHDPVLYNFGKEKGLTLEKVLDYAELEKNIDISPSVFTSDYRVRTFLERLEREEPDRYRRMKLELFHETNTADSVQIK